MTTEADRDGPRLTPALATSTIIAALGGLLFGFDTAAISGTTAALQSVFGLSGFWLGFTVASALIGTIVGSVVVGRLHASSVWSVWNVWGQVLYCSILRANASISRPDPGS